ncbi:phage tail tape measure protein [Ancylobacter sp. VNQ12]|uniref:phage tail tape measure protein n=1 Tax=Ancylobacter sp. VNQ12 TaxID=3400920 RepID=UPI003C074E65
MAREIEAKLKISAQDRTAKAFAAVEARIKRAQRVADEAARKSAQIARVEKAAARHQAVAAGLSRAGGLAAGALGGIGAAAAIKSFAALERQMTRVGLAAGATDAETKEATKQIAKMSMDLALPLDQAYAGLDALVATGKSLPEAMAFLPSILTTAQASGAATDELSTSANALGTSFKVAGSEMQRAFDMLVAGGQLGQFELKDMAQYLPSLTASAAKLGFTGLEGTSKLVAMLQTVRQVSGDSSEAATAVGDAIEKTLSPTVANAFKKRGIDIGRVLEDAAKKGQNQFEAVIDVLRRMTNGMSDTQRNMLISSIYTDKEARRAVTAMLTLTDAYQGYVDAVNNSAGTTEANLKRVLADSQTRVDRLSNSLKELTNAAGGFLDGLGVTGGAEGLAEGLNNLNEMRQRELDFFTAVEKGKEGMSAWERLKFNMSSSPEEVRAMAIKGGWKPNPEDVAATAQRHQAAAAGSIIDYENGLFPQVPGELERLYQAHAEAEAKRYGAAIDAGSFTPPLWLQKLEAANWGNITDLATGVPLPAANPLRTVPLPPANPLRPAGAPLRFNEAVPGGSVFEDGHSDLLASPAPSPGRGDNWIPAPPPIESIDSHSVDRLRAAMDGAGDSVKSGGADAATAILDAMRTGVGLLERAADRLKQSLTSGAAAVSSAKVQVQVPAARTTPNANLGQSMPNAGRLPESN